MILKTDNITMQFGGVTAVNLLNIEINEHEIVALIGPNGAGKTTAFNMITGVYTPTSGDVVYTDAKGEQQTITGKRPSEIAKMGCGTYLPEYPTVQKLIRVRKRYDRQASAS